MPPVQAKRVLVLCPYPEDVAPSQRFKYEQYLPWLGAQGYAFTVSPFMSRRLWQIVYRRGHLLEKVAWSVLGYARRVFDLLRLPFYDGAYVSLHVTPFGPPFFERLARVAARRIVYDIDDLIWLTRTSPRNRLIGFLKTRSKPLYLMRVADHVITSTPYLERTARECGNEHVTDISSTIETDRIRPGTRAAARLVIGWTGTHTTSPYLRLLERVLARLWEKHDFKLLVIGDPTFAMPGRDVEVVPWTAETEVEQLQRIDVGVYPLPDEEWVQGKSGLKSLQYGALGIPCVATAAGTSHRTVEDGVTGFLVRDEAEWVDRLERLIADADLRRRMGEAARARIVERFSVAANGPRYLEVFRAAFG
jgi:glycosyltransferase involved in cell wall biosynthesis